MEIDKKIIIKLVQALEDLKKSLKGVEIDNIKDLVEEEVDLSDKILVTSPIVGTVYLAAEPGGKKFTEVGKKIKKGDTIIACGFGVGLSWGIVKIKWAAKK